MEPSSTQLIKRIIRISLFLMFVAGIIWFLPNWVLSYTKTTVLQENITTKHTDIQPFIEQISLTSIGEDSKEGVLFLRYMTPSPQEEAQKLRVSLLNKNVENYHIAIDNTDHEIYIYNRGLLQYRILFIQEITAPKPPKEKRPMIAVVIGGLGFHNDTYITEHPIPLTLAFSAHAPFSPLLAHHGGLHWHEIIVDIRSTNVPNPIQTLPFASGLLALKPPEKTSSNQTELYPSTDLKTQTKNPLPLLTKKHLDIPSLIIRGKEKAIEHGFAGILIERDDPDLQIVLDWTNEAYSEGFFIVMASELRYRNEHRPQARKAPTTPE